jgi:hypothetical protein
LPLGVCSFLEHREDRRKLPSPRRATFHKWNAESAVLPLHNSAKLCCFLALDYFITLKTLCQELFVILFLLFCF